MGARRHQHCDVECLGQALQQPLWKLWGTHKEKVSLYGSGGWISYSIDELIEEVTNYVDRGFKAVKIKVGSPNWKTDVERLKKVRAAVGDNVNIIDCMPIKE